MSGAAVSARGVCAGYGSRRVLSGFDLDVETGAFVAVAGPNGVGKSTLLRLMAGAMKPTRGDVRVMGEDVSALSARARARLVAVVPQTAEMPPGMPALEVVLMGRTPHLGLLSWESEADVEIAADAMRMTDTLEFMQRPVDRLSGGERQRVAIAIALAQQTPVALLDEPTANLDLAYQPAIMRLLRQLADDGKTIVAAVHDLTLAAQFCDEIALVSGGACVGAGAPTAMLTPERIKAVYGADVRVVEHPDTGAPIVVSAYGAGAVRDRRGRRGGKACPAPAPRKRG